MSATCKSCDAPILWATTRKGKLMPLDAEPVAGAVPGPGIFTLGTFDIEKQKDLAMLAKPGDRGPFYTSHFATCPDAAKFRRAK